MASAYFYFHPQLSALLSRRNRGTEVIRQFRDRPSVKDVIEACGVPHTEIDVILVNGRSVSFDWRLEDGERVDIFPYGFCPDTEPLTHLTPPLRHPVRFALDVHLGKLARRLRLLGFDCYYRNTCDDPELISLALAEQRIILTCDRGILKHARVQHGLLLRSRDADEQVREVLRRYRLVDMINPFQRCPTCNGSVEMVEKETIRHHLLPGTAENYEFFYQCCECRKLFWKGAHYPRIAQWIDAMRKL